MTAVRYPGPFFYRQSRRTSSSHSFPHDTDKLCSILTIIFFVSHINATRAIDLLPSPLSTSFLSLHLPMPNANIRLSCRNHLHILSPLSLMRGVRAYHATRTYSGLGHTAKGRGINMRVTRRYASCTWPRQAPARSASDVNSDSHDRYALVDTCCLCARTHIVHWKENLSEPIFALAFWRECW